MMNIENLVLQNNDFTYLKLAVGTKTSSSFNYITKKLNRNEKGYINDNIKDISLSAILIGISNGYFINESKKIQKKSLDKNKSLKHCAFSIFSFHKYRYKQEDRDENNHLIRHNASFIHNLGFQGFDFDPEKGKYTDEERREIAETLKQILYDELHDKKWFICSTLSTGGNGAHCYTWSKVNIYIDNDERIRWYYTNYDMKLRYMCKCLYELKNRLPWVDLSKITIDDAMRRPGQTLNITVADTEPLINYNFKYDYDDDVVEQFNHYNTTYKALSDEALLMASDEDKFIYNLYMSYVNTTKNDETKYDNKEKNFNEHILVKCKDFDLSKCKPYYWRHKQNQNKGWTGTQVIHTLLWFFDKETVKQIWSHPNFYTEDPKDWIRFVDSWTFDDKHMPNFKLINFLNEECGFNLQYEHIIEAKSLEERYDKVIHLENDEYLGDKEQEIFDSIKVGINLIIAGVGTGKTTLWINRDKRLKDDILNIGMMKSTIITEPYNAILNTKFGVGGYECQIYKGHRHFNWNTLDKGLTASNYKKLVELGDKEKIDWTQIDYIVCDESHLLTKEYFRSGDLIKMIDFLKKASEHIPVILMTGTPSDETDIFENINTIYIDKPDKREIHYRWLRFTPDKDVISKWDIIAISSLIKALVTEEHRKVYVYDGNGSLKKFKKLMRCIPDIRCCIYHKRHIDDVINSDDMKYIDEYHELGDKYDVLLSSCYFGVGNDLNDDCDTACIIIGNHTWQEDVQVVGRWRNSMNIKTYCVIEKWEEKHAEPKDKSLMLKDMTANINKAFHDYLERDRNITIRSSIIHIDNSNDIPTLALMKIHELYNTPINYKREKLEDNYFIVDDSQICPLRWVDNDIIFGDSINKIMQMETENFKNQFLMELVKCKTIKWHNEDGKLLQWQKTAKFIYDHYINLFKELYIDSTYGISNNHQNSLELFCNISRRYNGALDAEYIDWAEVRAWHWYLTELSKVNVKEKNIEYIKKSGINYEEHIGIVSYILMVTYTNNDNDNTKMIDGDYFNKFFERCKWYYGMKQSMVDLLINMNKKTYVGDDIFDLDEKIISEYKDMNKKVQKIHDISKVKLIEMKIYKTIYSRLKYKRSMAKKDNGQKGGQKGKQVVITANMKQSTLNKYGLKVGDIFETQKKLSIKINVSVQTLSKWRDKKWIE